MSIGALKDSRTDQVPCSIEASCICTTYMLVYVRHICRRFLLGHLAISSETTVGWQSCSHDNVAHQGDIIAVDGVVFRCFCYCVRFMSEQLVPATPVVELHTQQGAPYVCVGLDALSAADELVEGVAVDLQHVIAQMKQAAHVKYTPGARFGTDNKAVLHTYVQVTYLPSYHDVFGTSTFGNTTWSAMPTPRVPAGSSAPFIPISI